jgi:molybdopterin converting factor subunit 1
MTNIIQAESNSNLASAPLKTIQIQYFALLREVRGSSQETIETAADTPLALYQFLQERYHFPLTPEQLRVAINENFVTWETPLQTHDRVVFIPPVAGG